MNGSRYVVRGTQLAARMLGDEMMFMSASTSTLFTLNEVAAFIWQAADGATPQKAEKSNWRSRPE